MKFWNFPKKTGDNPELDEMIKNLAEEKNKENVIFDITNNSGGVSRPAEEIRSAVQKSGIKNVYVIYGKNSFSMVSASSEIKSSATITAMEDTAAMSWFSERAFWIS